MSLSCEARAQRNRGVSKDNHNHLLGKNKQALESSSVIWLKLEYLCKRNVATANNVKVLIINLKKNSVLYFIFVKMFKKSSLNF